MPYVVSGPSIVAGVAPGDVVEDEALGSADVAHLIETGHLVAVAPPKPNTKADQAITPKEQ